MSWIIAWHYLRPGLALLIMLVLLISLTMIFLKLSTLKFYSLKEELFIRSSFTIYFAWICVATIANTSAWLVSIGWNGAPLSAELWTLLMMTMAAILAAFITLKFKTPSFAAVVIWALAGIYRRWENTLQRTIAETAMVLLVLVAGIFIYTLLNKFRTGKIKNRS